MKSLNGYRRNVFSQAGEDGIVEFLVEKLQLGKGWCVEFGAWDGKHLSNTRNLILNHGWSAVMVEGDREKFSQLEREYAGNGNVHTLCRMVGHRPDDPNGLDRVLAETPLPKRFHFLSVDVDGNDWYIWDSLKDYEARIVAIEANSTIPPDVVKVGPPGSGVGASARALVELGRRKGYELVAHTGNCVFVKRELLAAVGLDDNSLACLFDRAFLKPPSLASRILTRLGFKG